MGRLRAIIPIVLALVVALGASYYIYDWLRKQAVVSDVPGISEAKTVEVAVAEMDIGWGTKIKPEMVSMVSFLKKSLPPGHFTTVEELVGRIVITPLKKNEPILESRLASTSVKTGGVSALISPGKRAISVRGDKVIGISGFIRPGNRVDVLVTMTDPSASDKARRQVTKVVLENLKVLATGTQLDKDAEGKPQPVDVYTLEVTMEEGEKLALASTQGKLHFALRNETDDDTVITEGATIPNTLASFSPSNPPPPPPVEDEAKDEAEEDKVNKPKPVVQWTPPAPTRVKVHVIKGTKSSEVDIQ